MIKTLAKSIRQYKKQSIITPCIMVVEAAMEILIPFVMSMLLKLLEDASAANAAVDVMGVVKYGGIMVAMAVLSMLAGVLGGALASQASAGFAANLRGDMYRKIQSYSFANIDKFSTSSLITRLTTDITNVQLAYQLSIRLLVRAPIMFIFASVMAFVVNATIAWIFVIAAVVMALVIVFVVFQAMPAFRSMFKKYDKLNAIAQENLTGIRVVKSYVREEHEIEKYKKATQETYNFSIKAEKWIITLLPAVQAIIYITMILLFVFGGNLYVNNNLAISDLTALLQYAMQILVGVMMLAIALNFIAIAKPSADRIYEVLKEESDLTSPENAKTEVKDGSIDFENVRFAYKDGGENILADIDLHIASGETIGVIGGTGSAKSTLVSLIPRLYDVTAGKVKVGGVDVKEYDLETLRNDVAMVLQKNVLFSGSIIDNMRWGNENATMEQIEAACAQAQATEFIHRLPGEYNYDLGQGGVNVSGGQKQRLCIARALLKNPKVLIFDDSTSAVDTKTDALIRGELQKTAPDCTKIIIAQRIASVQDADRIIVMNEGKIVGIGTHEELLKNNEIYQEVYYSQVKGGEE
ncbi:MAG: ABC transporter ATP-binding protein [Clostridia bacterium]|nr:ABC transporter ATP-binding protein [Clostridia bacterium]